MIVKGFQHIRFVVLAGDCQQNAGALLAEKKILQRPPPLIDLHRLRAVFAANARPERVVAIEGDDLQGLALDRLHRSYDIGSQPGEKLNAIRNVCGAFGNDVFDFANPVTRDDGAGREQVEIVAASQIVFDRREDGSRNSPVLAGLQKLR